VIGVGSVREFNLNEDAENMSDFDRQKIFILAGMIRSFFEDIRDDGDVSQSVIFSALLTATVNFAIEAKAHEELSCSLARMIELLKNDLMQEGHH
jgi:hypothetical protein